MMKMNHPGIFLDFYRLHLEIDYYMSNSPSMLSYFQIRKMLDLFTHPNHNKTLYNPVV